MSDSKIGSGFGTIRPPRPPLPELPQHVVPHMANEAALPPVEPPKAWKVQAPEIDELMGWVVPLLKARWANLDEASFLFMARAATSDRKTLFARTAGICGVFHVEHDCFEPHGVVREVFTRAREKGNHEEQSLFHRFVRDWSVRIGAAELHFGANSNCNLEKLATALQDVRLNSNVRDRRGYWVILRE